MQATATAKPFRRAGWLFELKYDRFRVLVIKQGKQARLLSRRGREDHDAINLRVVFRGEIAFRGIRR